MTRGTLKVGVLPRDPNPYQRLLYEAMTHQGVEVTYLGELTPSHSLNLLLLPGEVVARGRRGLDIVHMHWVFGFRLPGRSRARAVGLLSQLWFHVFLFAVRASGAQLVWTAHNVLPHQPVFWDDLAARRLLVNAADLVIAHGEATISQLEALGIHPRRAAVVPHGPFPRSIGTGDRAPLDVRTGPIQFAFIGAVAAYKGVEDLLDSFAALEDRSTRLVVAGACDDPALEHQLLQAAAQLGDRVEVHLRRLSDAELDDVLATSDVVVLPYRSVTTSGSAVLALGASRPLVVPDLPGLADLPSGAVFRYAPTAGLIGALGRAAATPRPALAAMGETGLAHVLGNSWEAIAELTADLLRAISDRTAPAPTAPVEDRRGTDDPAGRADRHESAP